MIPSVLLRNASKLKFLLNENSTTILTGLGVTGTVATAYLTGRATFKAAELIAHDEAVANTGVEPGADPVYLTKKDKVKIVWKVYAPPVAAGAITITSIITANRISSKKIAALVVASGVSERAFQEYKDKVVERLGQKKHEDIRAGVAQDRVDRNPVGTNEVIVTGKGDVLFYDEHSGRYFYSTMETVRRAENRINHELLEGMGCSLSEFYDEIGMKASNYSDSVGWNGGERMEVEFSTTLSEDGRPCISIDFKKPPITTYNRHTYG